MVTRGMKENSRRDELREGWEGMSNGTGTLIESILKTEELVREYTGLNNDNEMKRAIDGEEWEWGRREGNSRSEHLARLASGVCCPESPGRIG